MRCVCGVVCVCVVYSATFSVMKLPARDGLPCVCVALTLPGVGLVDRRSQRGR